MRYVIWDFDGTLAEREGRWAGALAEVASAAGLAVPAEQLRPYLQAGFPWHDPDRVRDADEPADVWWARLEPVFMHAFQIALEVRVDQAVQLAQAVRPAYIQPDRWRVFDDVPDALRDLAAAGWRHVILSNHVPELPELVASLGLTDHFDHVFCSARTGVEKPHRHAYEQVMAALPANATAWMVGDSYTADVRGPGVCGIPAVLVRRSHPEASRCCPDLCELPAALLANGTPKGEGRPDR